MGEHPRPDAVASDEGRDAHLHGTAAAQPARTGPANVAPSVAPVLALQRAAGNRVTVSALGLARSAAGTPSVLGGRADRRLARCSANCSCPRCSARTAPESDEDRFSASLRGAVLARASAPGLQRQADAGADPTPSDADLDAGARDGGESLPGGVTTPPGPAPPPDPRDNCRVQVRNTHIGGSLSWAPIWHLYIVHTDEHGRQTGWRGGPGGRGASGTYGAIIGTTGRYAPGFIDWDPDSDAVTVGAGSGVCGATSCFASELSRIDAKHTPYSPTGPNSNTWVRTVLHNCGLREDKPVAIAPGFGDPYL